MSADSHPTELQNKLRGFVLPTTRLCVRVLPLMALAIPAGAVILMMPARVRQLIMFKEQSAATFASAVAMTGFGELVVPPAGNSI
jgi:hypothetical protein